MKLTPRGRGVVAGAIMGALLVVFVWAAMKDAGMMRGYERHCAQTGTCGAPAAP